MAALADLFPLLVLITVVALGLLALRLQLRLSRNPFSAGPHEHPTVAPPGQEPSPWELRAIERQLYASFGSTNLTSSAVGVNHFDLVATVNRLLAAGGIDRRHHLRPNASVADLDSAITLLERQLALPPLSAPSLGSAPAGQAPVNQGPSS